MLDYQDLSFGPDLQVSRWVCSLPAGRPSKQAS